MDESETPEIVIEELQTGVVAREAGNGNAYIFDVNAALVVDLDETK